MGVGNTRYYFPWQSIKFSKIVPIDNLELVSRFSLTNILYTHLYNFLLSWLVTPQIVVPVLY